MLQKDVIKPNVDDMRYIKKVVDRIPTDVVNLIHGAYCQAWLDSYHSEPLEHKKENAGRYAANNLIRKLARQYMESGKVDIPRVCGNCDHCESWQGQYYCARFKQEIPVDYVTKENDCDQYENAIPF